MLLAGFTSFAEARSTSPGGDPPEPPDAALAVTGSGRPRYICGASRGGDPPGPPDAALAVTGSGRPRYICGAGPGGGPTEPPMRHSPLPVLSAALHPQAGRG